MPLDLIQSKSQPTVNNPNTPLTLDEELLQSMQDTNQFGQTVVAPAIKETAQRVGTANRTLLDTTKRLSAEREAPLDEIRAAQDRLFNLEQNPDIVNKILGIFDSDFNEGAQIRRMQRSQFELNEITNRMSIAETTRNVQVQGAGTQLKAVTDFYEFTRQGVLDNASAILTGFQIRNNVRQDQVQLVKDTPKETLEKWQTNPDLMPPKLSGLRELVTADLFRRQVDDARLTSVDIANTQARENLFNTQRENFMNQFNTADELLAAQQQFQNAPQEFPRFLRVNDFNTELQEREGVAISLRSAKQSIEANDLALADVHKKQALAKSSLTDIDSALGQLDASGNVDVAGVIFSGAELGVARSLKQQQLIESQKQNALLISAITQADTLRDQNVEGALALGSMGNPYGDPLVGMPTTTRGAVQSSQNLENNLRPRIAAGDVGAAIVMSKQWQATNELINKDIEERIKNTTTASKPAVSEFLKQGGRITTPSAAAGFLIENAPNQFALDADSMLKTGYRGFAEELIASNTGGTSFNITDEGGISVIGDDQQNAAIINQAIKDSGLRTKVGDSGFQILLQQTLSRLAANADGTAIDPNSPYAGLVDSDGRLADSLFQIELGQPKLFSYDNFYKALANRQTDAIASGLIPAGKSLSNPIIDAMRQGATGLNERFTASPTAAALKNAAFPNGVQELIYKRLADMASTVPVIIQNAIINRQGLTDAVQREVILNREDLMPGS